MQKTKMETPKLTSMLTQIVLRDKF